MKYAPEAAEAVGAFALVFIGCGAIMASAATGLPDHLGISLAFGLIIGSMIYATGHISGAHFNPAVTIAFAVTGHFPWARVISYVASQITGGLVAIGLLAAVFETPTTFGQTAVSDVLNGMWGGFVVEVIATAILMFVIASVATDGRAVGKLAGSAIGATVALDAIVAGPLTGASMNPARSIAPAVASGAVDSMLLIVYIIGPIIGALLGAFLYELLRGGNKPEGRRMQ